MCPRGDRKDPTVFVSEVLAEAMFEVLTNPPPLDRAHCSFGPKSVVGANLPKALCCVFTVNMTGSFHSDGPNSTS